MIAVTLAALAGWTATVAGLASLLRSQARAHARREDLLINQILHATGKPWAPAPATPEPAPEVETRGWTASPEQLPV